MYSNVCVCLRLVELKRGVATKRERKRNGENFVTRIILASHITAGILNIQYNIITITAFITFHSYQVRRVERR